MTGKVIQGSFLSGQPKLPSPVSARLQPPIQAKTATRPPPARPFGVRPPGPLAPAFAARPPGPPVPAFAGRPGAVQRYGAGGVFAVEAGQLGLASGSGKPLPEVVRGKMEAALGADFSTVRVHVGPQAERIGAIAFTIGSDIHFAPGRYQPDTVHGQQLLGHELTHVVQQRQGRVRVPASAELAIVQDRVLEAEADRLGWAAARHVPARPLNPTVQRSAIGPALPRQMPPAQAARPATVQRKITHDGTNYVGDEDRPKWRALLKKYVIDEYNSRTGGSLAYNVDLTDEDLDRCHRVSFSDIEALILGFLNGSVSSTDFILLTDTVKAGTDYNAFGKTRTSLINSKAMGLAAPQLLGWANSLLSMLNSATFNVALGNARTNRGIQEKLDLHFSYTGTAYSLTPNSRAIVTNFVGHTSGVPLTPNATNIRSSFAAGGTVPLGNLTPNSTTLIGYHT